MGWALDSPPILPCGNTNTIDPIHYSFIMGSCSISVNFSKLESLKYFLCYFCSINSLPTHLFNRNLKITKCLSFNAVVTQNCNSCLNSHFGYTIFGFFADCVCYICPHCLTHIYKYIDGVLLWKWITKLSDS